MASTLAEIRERYDHGAKITATGRDVCASADDVPALLAAVEAALKAAHEWDVKAAELDGMAYRAAARGADPDRTALMSARAQAHQDDAQALRAAITAAVSTTGEEGP